MALHRQSEKSSKYLATITSPENKCFYSIPLA
jgi:hypothetical protein